MSKYQHKLAILGVTVPRSMKGTFVFTAYPKGAPCTFRATRPDNFKAFYDGAFSIQLFPDMSDTVRCLESYGDLRSDWQRVGKDMAHAMNAFAVETGEEPDYERKPA